MIEIFRYFRTVKYDHRIKDLVTTNKGGIACKFVSGYLSFVVVPLHEEFTAALAKSLLNSACSIHFDGSLPKSETLPTVVSKYASNVELWHIQALLASNKKQKEIMELCNNILAEASPTVAYHDL